MFRFSLATFLLVVALISLVFAGLAYPNAWWRQVVATMTLTVLLAGLLTAIGWQKVGRWFWVGFAVAGGFYLAFVFFGGDEARSTLLTHSAVIQLDQMLETSTPALPPSGERVTLAGDVIYLDHMRQLSIEEAEQKGLLKYAYTISTMPSPEKFRDIGHYGWALLVGCIGGIFSLWLHRKSTATRGT